MAGLLFGLVGCCFSLTVLFLLSVFVWEQVVRPVWVRQGQVAEARAAGVRLAASFDQNRQARR